MTSRNLLRWTGVLVVVPLLSLTLYHICPHWNHLINRTTNNGICPGGRDDQRPPPSSSLSKSTSSLSDPNSAPLESSSPSFSTISIQESQHQQEPQEPQASDKHNNFLLDIKRTSLSEFVPLLLRLRHQTTTTNTAAAAATKTTTSVQRVEDYTLDSVDRFNRIHLGPRLGSIVNQDYFRYVKLNLFRPCSLWPDDAKCALKDCSVEVCRESDLPSVILEKDQEILAAAAAADRLTIETPSPDGSCPNESEQELGLVNKTVPDSQVEAMNKLFECDEHEQSDGGHYIDLTYNPERFTGYGGESAHRIWSAIYEENCFLAMGGTDSGHKVHRHRAAAAAGGGGGPGGRLPFSEWFDSLCYEERMFYRAISGLHTSINIHLCALHLDSAASGAFRPNLKEFLARFRGREDYIKNLYFLYLLELRALQRAESYLLSRVTWSSGSGDLQETREAIRDLLRASKRLDIAFDEAELFHDRRPDVAVQFSDHFRNITSHIMDCVGCQKCKLWGKIQTHGLGTAFKILLTDTAASSGQLRLSRYEITTLINGLARLSDSIAQLEYFSQMIDHHQEDTRSPPSAAAGRRPAAHEDKNPFRPPPARGAVPGILLKPNP